MLVVGEIEKHSTAIQKPLLSAMAMDRMKNSTTRLQKFQERTRNFKMADKGNSSFSLSYSSKLVSEIVIFNSKVVDELLKNDGETIENQGFQNATLAFSSGQICVRQADSGLEDDILLKTGVERVVLMAQVLFNLTPGTKIVLIL